jgi:lysine-specific demethylase 3
MTAGALKDERATAGEQQIPPGKEVDLAPLCAKAKAKSKGLLPQNQNQMNKMKLMMQVGETTTTTTTVKQQQQQQHEREREREENNNNENENESDQTAPITIPGGGSTGANGGSDTSAQKLAPNTPDVSPDGGPVVSLMRRTGKRKAAQIAKERVAGQMASELKPITSLHKRSSKDTTSPSGSPRTNNSSCSSLTPLKKEEASSFGGGGYLRTKLDEATTTTTTQSHHTPVEKKPRFSKTTVSGKGVARRLETSQLGGGSSWREHQQMAMNNNDEETETETEAEDQEDHHHFSSPEFEGSLLTAKLSRTYKALDKKDKKKSKAELKNWIALLTAVERELYGNSVKNKSFNNSGVVASPPKSTTKKGGKTAGGGQHSGSKAEQMRQKQQNAGSNGGCGGGCNCKGGSKAGHRAVAIKKDNGGGVKLKAKQQQENGGGEGEGGEGEKDYDWNTGTSHKFLVKKVAGICCHHCQRGKELVRCSRGGCRLHYCTECLKRCYPGLTIEQCREQCPRCMGICNCKYALRMDKRCNRVPIDVGALPYYSKQTRAGHHNYMWNTLVASQKSLSKILEDEFYELRVESEMQGREVTMQRLPILQDAGYRVLCSKCNTTIGNVLRTCNSCGYDLCPQCCTEMRGVETKSEAGDIPEQAKQSLCCPSKTDKEGGSTCGKKLELMRLNYLLEECMGAFKSSLLPAAHKGASRSQQETTEAATTKVSPAGSETAPKGGSVCIANADYLNSKEGLEYFQENWKKGCPFVVPNIRGRILWTPHLMKRAATEKRKGEYTTDVIDCSSHQVIEVSIEAFFNGYTGETQFEGNPMYKLKDWPTEEAFKDKLKRLFFDFVDMIPLKEYTHPSAGPLNLAAKIPEGVTHKPDLGPKCYIAYGRKEEQEAPGDLLQMDGDSVTKLHLDVSDAINVLVHCQKVEDAAGQSKEEMGQQARENFSLSDSNCSEGALWHIFRREDTPKLRSFLLRHRERFTHNMHKVDDQGNPILSDPILDQLFYLSSRALKLLKEEEGVEPWTVVQKEHDAVIVPAGCAHQVRNLSSCIKVAMDFVSPESVPEVLSLTQSYRKLPNTHFASNDKVQARLMVLSAAWETFEGLKEWQNFKDHIYDLPDVKHVWRTT